MKLLLLSALLLSIPAYGQQSQTEPVAAPEPLCTSGVNAGECKILTNLLSFRQLGSFPARLVQFVLADDVAYKAEKLRLETIRKNILNSTKGKEQERAFAAPGYLVSGLTETIFELKESNPMIVLKVYFNETDACHEDTKTSKGDFDLSMCAGGIEYAIGFIDGILLGTNNYNSFVFTER